MRYGDAANRREWFEQIARTRRALEPYIGEFARFKEARSKRVLEIGVGSGSDFIRWCEYADHATGVDLTAAGVALTAERLSLAGVPESRYTLLMADAERLPFPDRSFDIVYSWGVLHHTPDTERAYREVLRVLKPGGAMRTMIYHAYSWTGLMLYLVHGFSRARFSLGLRGAIYHYLESPGTKSYSRAEGAALASQAGLRDVRATTRLGPGDLLLIKPSARYQGALARAAFALYPRPLVRLFGDRFGLYLLIQGSKPL